MGEQAHDKPDKDKPEHPHDEPPGHSGEHPEHPHGGPPGQDKPRPAHPIVEPEEEDDAETQK